MRFGSALLIDVLRAGLYLLISLVILMNLLIAMLTDTYQEIEEESDKEWKFGRAKLIRNMQKTVRLLDENTNYLDYIVPRTLFSVLVQLVNSSTRV